MIFRRGMVFGGISIWGFLCYMYGAIGALSRDSFTVNFDLIQAVLQLLLGIAFITCSVKYDRSEMKRKVLITSFILSILLTVISVVVQFKFFIEAGPVQIIVLLLSAAFIFVIEIFAIRDLKDYVEYERDV